MSVESNNNAISVNNVTKIYRLYEKPIDRLKEVMSPTHKNYHRDFYALSGISFDVPKGQTVGIIGTNGSGKSTILKIITGVLTPTDGTLKVSGVISALLELGAGFNMDYTGIENIYMNGTMMGFSRKEMDDKLKDILDFADIGDFVYQPVKTYSSGMFVRLAFALAINVEPEILIVDEALSVGDVFFQAKCYRRMEEIRQKGTTILMVTHDMGAIIKYCDQVVVLNKGNFIAQGEPGKMVDLYKKILANQMDDLSLDLEEIRSGELNDFSGEQVKSRSDINALKEGFMKDKLTVNPNRTEYGDKKAEIVDFGLIDERGNLSNLLLKGEYFTIKEKIQFHGNIESPIFTYTIKDKRGADLTGTNTMYEASDVESVKQGDVYEVEFKQKMTLQGGEYLLSMSCTGFENGEHVVYHRLYDIVNITVISNKNTVGIYDMEPKVSLKLHRDRG
ncbi:ABC transporter ATP-binding protein [Lacrimispora algidixylanolytica]|uniref:ABC transporter n=1 Tax=Lacrimispora algidixylanolytica TaxID=94868 RepID=A0A419TBL5_9FIRM|nr:ABC transporter ATP-binding protein [Lacrimispora algidixylanolytica]RKD34860.1 ABC transporter [Lacrimispora algidixylanolytica]